MSVGDVVLAGFILVGYSWSVLGVMNSNNEAIQSLFAPPREQQWGVFALVGASLLSVISLLVLLLMVPWVKVQKISLGSIWLLLVLGTITAISGTLWVLERSKRLMAFGIIIVFVVVSILAGTFSILQAVIVLGAVLIVAILPISYSVRAMHGDDS